MRRGRALTLNNIAFDNELLVQEEEASHSAWSPGPWDDIGKTPTDVGPPYPIVPFAAEGFF